MNNKLTAHETQRYKKHIQLPEVGVEGQEKLKAIKVLSIGAGGLGAPLLQYISAAGVGTVGICDEDKVELSNLHRQLLYGDDSVGEYKTQVAQKRLHQQNHNTKIIIHDKFISAENANEILSQYDIIVDCTDNISTRYLVSDVCKELGKPLVYASVYKYEGQVSVFSYEGGPSYRDVYPETDKRETFEPASAGLFGTLPAIIGSLQAMEVIKIATGIGEVLSGKIFYMNTLTLKSYTMSM